MWGGNRAPGVGLLAPGRPAPQGWHGKPGLRPGLCRQLGGKASGGGGRENWAGQDSHRGPSPTADTAAVGSGGWGLPSTVRMPTQVPPTLGTPQGPGQNGSSCTASDQVENQQRDGVFQRRSRKALEQYEAAAPPEKARNGRPDRGTEGARAQGQGHTRCLGSGGRPWLTVKPMGGWHSRLGCRWHKAVELYSESPESCPRWPGLQVLRGCSAGGPQALHLGHPWGPQRSCFPLPSPLSPLLGIQGLREQGWGGLAPWSPAGTPGFQTPSPATHFYFPSCGAGNN